MNSSARWSAATSGRLSSCRGAVQYSVHLSVHRCAVSCSYLVQTRPVGDDELLEGQWQRQPGGDLGIHGHSAAAPREAGHHQGLRAQGLQELVCDRHLHKCAVVLACASWCHLQRRAHAAGELGVQVVVELHRAEVVQPGLTGLLLLEAPACTTEPDE